MYKLLIIDDEEVIRSGIRSIIERSEINFSHIYEASNGKEGINIIKKISPDIVITDIKMPHIDGLKFIEWVYENIEKKPEFIIISGYDDFSYAKQAIHFGVKEYLLKPIGKAELIGILRNITNQLIDYESKYYSEHMQYVRSKEGMEALKEKYLNILIQSNNDQKKSTILNELARVGFEINEVFIRVIVLEYKEINARKRNEFDEIDRFAVKNIVDEIIQTYDLKYISFYDRDNKLVILIYNTKILFDSDINKIINKTNKCLNKYINISIYAGVGRKVKNFKKVNISYNEAIYSARNKIINSDNEIFFYNENIDENSINKSYIKFFSKISSEVEFCNKFKIIESVNECFKEYFDTWKNNVLMIQNFYNELNKYIYNYFNNNPVNFSEVFNDSEKYFRDFDLFWSIDDLKSYIKKYLIKVSNLVSIYKNNNPDSKVVQSIIRYIQENYYKNINLNIVSDKYDINNSYLSVLFKKETGKNFVEYLTEVRIDKAKYLLKDRNFKIKEVGQKVGYHNSKHFGTVFKKEVGLTPKEFRKKTI